MQRGTKGFSFSSSESWSILTGVEQSIKFKIETYGIKLSEWNVSINYGIKTGLNEAFIINTETRDKIVAEDPRSAEIIRPILRGRDIKRYGYNHAGLWVINTHNGIKEIGRPKIEIGDYPAIKAHLDEFYDKLEHRADKGDTPYNLRNCAYMDDFSKPKIIWGNLCLSAQFAYTEETFFINAPSPMIVPGNKYLLAVMNSKLADWYIRNLGVTRNGGYFEYKPMFVSQLPVPVLSESEQKMFVEIVDAIIDKHTSANEKQMLERKIDSLVFELYGLSDAERQYIDDDYN